MSDAIPDRDSGRVLTIARYFAAVEAGDFATLTEILMPDARTRWPQSGEQITGAESCIRVYASYPGGPPSVRLSRVTGSGDTWVAELVTDYGPDRWYVVSILEFSGSRIAAITDYFGPSLPAPEWRQELVDPLPVGAPAA